MHEEASLKDEMSELVRRDRERAKERRPTLPQAERAQAVAPEPQPGLGARLRRLLGAGS